LEAAANVRFGSEADISQYNRHVRFTPQKQTFEQFWGSYTSVIKFFEQLVPQVRERNEPDATEDE
jgi:hypothetical protein